MWEILKICVKHDLIIIMQAANTGLTGGSTPYGNDYDRPVVIINTLKIKTIQIINEGKQIIALAGSTLYDLENKLKPINREPHSVIGSTSIGASIVGGCVTILEDHLFTEDQLLHNFPCMRKSMKKVI